MAYYGALTMIHAASLDDVKARHGVVGEDKVAVALVKGAVATRAVEIYHHGRAWNALVLDLFPRLRERA